MPSKRYSPRSASFPHNDHRVDPVSNFQLLSRGLHATIPAMGRKAFIADHIAAAPMFAACSRHELQTISRLATEIDVPTGQALTKEGTPGHEFMIVLSGTAEATRNGKHVATFTEGDFFGEIALLDPGVRTATIVSSTQMTLAVISPNEFSTALDEVPTLSRKVMQGLARRLREIDKTTFA
jgi:CRP/FNR family cyclic AMP-dependent transcriptional regulator